MGVASYLLIGFWYTRQTARNAAIKAFVVNRVGDFGLALGVACTFMVFDSVQYDAIFQAVPHAADSVIHVFGHDYNALEVIGFLLFVGAMGKSAQLPLHTWLPDAMEGPTPVSALIHAATMVTAGVFLVARFSPLYEHAPTALAFVTFIGATTCFFAASVGLTQPDIKRVIAYSTCSQLGYMFFAEGVSAYQAGIFHLYTHAFFKALLFLGAGSVIHALSDEQNIFKMGGVWRKIPVTYAVMWIGSLALAGIPPFAGYFSKDAILEAAWLSHNSFHLYAFWLGVLVAFMTAFYSWRLLFLVFHGEPRMDHHTYEHVHESPPVMLVPLIVLAVGAVVAGFLGVGMVHNPAHFFGAAIATHEGGAAEIEHVPFLIGILPLLAGLSGIALAYVLYIRRPDLPDRIVARIHPLYVFSYRKWFFDEIYDVLFVRSARALGLGLWRGGDEAVIDRFGPDGVAATALATARRAVRIQTGYVYHYAFAMLIGVMALVSYYFLVLRG